MHFSGSNPTEFPSHISHITGYQPTFPWISTAWYPEAKQPLKPASANSKSNSSVPFSIDTLRSLIKHFEMIDEVDINAILENEGQSIPFREKRKADLIVSTKQFHDWMVNNKSSELLVHGDFRRSRSASEPVSALSVFCATLTQTFRKAGHQQIPLVFFCGSHVERDDPQRGPAVMIRSFIAQLAKFWPLDATTVQNDQSKPYLQQEVETIVKEGTLTEICNLFIHLVRCLPESTTLVCIVDGIAHYETDNFEEGLLEVLGSLLDLARNGVTAATVKILASSPATTDQVQARFKDDDSSFISLAEIRDLGQGLGLEQLEDSDNGRAPSSSDHSEHSDD